MPSGSKGKTRRGKRKREPSVEDIYQNKLWRTQMPKEKNWETIFEEPVTKKGREEYQSNKKFKRLCNFDDFYNQNRLKKRRQKALKRGWKPLTKKKEERAGKLVEEKIMALDQQLIEAEIPDSSISETLSLLGDPLVSFSTEKTETCVTASPIKSVMSHKPSEIETDCKAEIMVDTTLAEVPNARSHADEEAVNEKDCSKSLDIACVKEDTGNDSGRSSQGDLEYFTPKALLTKKQLSTKDSSTVKSNLSAISEADHELFFTPAAKVNETYNSPPMELSSHVEDVSKSPNSSDRSSDSLSLSKTSVRPEEAADMSGVYSLSP